MMNELPDEMSLGQDDEMPTEPVNTVKDEEIPQTEKPGILDAFKAHRDAVLQSENPPSDEQLKLALTKLIERLGSKADVEYLTQLAIKEGLSNRLQAALDTRNEDEIRKILSVLQTTPVVR